MNLESFKVGAESDYRSLSDAEIRKLAVEVLADRVFGSWMFRQHDVHSIQCVFMPLALLDGIGLKTLIRNKPVHFYEYMSQAGPMAINGYPTFMSFHYLDKTDAERLQVAIDKLGSILNEFQNSSEPAGDQNG